MDQNMPFSDALKSLDVSSCTPNDIDFSETNYDIKFTLLPKQVPIVNETIEILQKYRSLTIKAATAFGKTIVIVYLAWRLKLKTLVIASKVSFVNNIYECFSQYSTAKVWNSVIKKKQSSIGVDVYMTTASSFHKIPNDALKDIGCLIIDESHQICTPGAIKPLLSTQPKYVVNCTATPERDDGMDILLTYLCGPHCVVSPLETPVRIIKVNTTIDIPISRLPDNRIDWGKHVSYLAECEERNMIVAILCKQIIEQDSESMIVRTLRSFTLPSTAESHYKIVIILGKLDKWLEPLTMMLDKLGISNDYIDSAKGKCRDADVIIGYRSKLGTGFDQKTGCTDFNGKRINVVMDLSTTKQQSLITQTIGRGCRANVCYYIPFIDKSRKEEEHYNKSVKPFINGHIDIQYCEYNIEKGNLLKEYKLKAEYTK
jgi:superfamily II DNA or RNA helicase